MSSQPTNPRTANSSKAVPKIKVRRKHRIDHAEIVRMAEAEAASRAAERRDTIATAAYFLAQKRGFEPGHELDDWLTAEADIAHALQLSILTTGADAP
jgi:hypothetical protein